MNTDIYFLIAKKLLYQEGGKDKERRENNYKNLKDMLSLRATCKIAKRACDIVIQSFKEELVFVGYINSGYGDFYVQLFKGNDKIAMRKYRGFLIKGIDILKGLPTYIAGCHNCPYN